MKKIFSLILALGALCFASCNPEEGVFSTDGKTPLDKPTEVSYESTMSAATISWLGVDKAGQYYYELRNSSNLVVKKGETTTASVEIAGLKHTTEYSFSVKAIPAYEFANAWCASDTTRVTIKTQEKLIRDYEWSQPATTWFEVDGKTTMKFTNAVFGLEKGTGYYVVEAWYGEEGFDLEFTVDKNVPTSQGHGSGWRMLPREDNDYAIFKAINGWELQLYHGIGGKEYDYVSWEHDNAYSCFYDFNTEEGGGCASWMNSPDREWGCWYLEYGVVETPEPEPWTPDPDPAEDWEDLGEVTLNGKKIEVDGEEVNVLANISYDSEKGTYTLAGWLGSTDYDLVFSRDAETGEWKIDYKNSSSYAADCPKDGGHGFYGVDGVYWLYDDEVESGLSGNSEDGYLWITLYTPKGEPVTYKASWPADNGDRDYNWHASGTVTFGPISGTATISYVAATKTYTLSSWLGVEGYDIVFTRNKKGVWVVDKEASSAYKADGNPGDLGFESGHGFTWLHVDYSELSGGDEGGYTSAWGWDPINGDWGEYCLEWDEMEITIDDLVGTYAQKTGAWYENPDWVWEDYYGDVTIAKVDDTHVSITGLINSEDALTGVVDLDEMTITIAAGSTFMNGEYEVRLSTMNAGVADDDPIVLNFTRTCSITTAISWAAKRLDGEKPWWDQVQATLTKK